MTPRSLRLGGRLRTLVLVALAATPMIRPLPPAAADDQPMLQGEGSSYVEPLINKLAETGLTQGGTSFGINYFGTGSKAGRKAFIDGTRDFAISDLPFTADEKTQLDSAGRKYAYAPMAAGALAFPYQLQTADPDPKGQGFLRIHDLKLSPRTVARIFTGKIATWADPDITADYGSEIHAQPGNIRVWVRSDANGTTLALSRWIKAVAPDVWTDFTKAHKLPDEPVEQ